MKKLIVTLIFILFIGITATSIAVPISPLSSPTNENMLMFFIGGALIGLGTYFRTAIN